MAESITVIKTNWQSDEGVIKSVRMPVFVQEQQVPYEIDFDIIAPMFDHQFVKGNPHLFLILSILVFLTLRNGQVSEIDL